MKRPYAVLGCGPAGLLAAHALTMYGREFIVLSERQKSKLGGAQYLHAPIVGLTAEDPPAELTYRVRGDAGVYQEKVYGATPVPFVSFTNQEDGRVVPAWPLLDVYDTLWTRYEPQIVNAELNHDVVRDLAKVFTVISAVPLNAICNSRGETHGFRSQTVLIANETLAEPMDDNTILYDGQPDVGWYRQSLIFGVPAVEYGPAAMVPAGVKVRQVRKPIETNCDCLPEVIKVGRYGRWEKGVLTHHGALDLLARLDAGEL